MTYGVMRGIPSRRNAVGNVVQDDLRLLPRATLVQHKAGQANRSLLETIAKASSSARSPITQVSQPIAAPQAGPAQ